MAGSSESKPVRLHPGKPLRSVRVIGWGEPAVPPAQAAALQKAAYDEGYQEAARVTAEEHAAKEAALRAELKQYLDRFEARFAELEQLVDAQLPVLVLDAVKRLLRGLEPEGERVRETIEDLLAGLGDETGDVTVLLPPDDFTAFAALADDEGVDRPGVRFQPDDALRTGDCVIRTRFGTVDATLDTKLRKLAEQLQGA